MLFKGVRKAVITAKLSKNGGIETLYTEEEVCRLLMEEWEKLTDEEWAELDRCGNIESNSCVCLLCNDDFSNSKASISLSPLSSCSSFCSSSFGMLVTVISKFSSSAKEICKKLHVIEKITKIIKLILISFCIND